MDLFEFIRSNWRELILLTGEHVEIVLLSTGIAVAVGLPLGILLTRNRSLQAPVLGFANVMQTVPSLALFGLLIPIPFIGGIGARTAIIALALYALLPVIRNTVTGIAGIDPKLLEAADAMGMSSAQRLRLVELPLAAPIILTGIRVSLVISVGVATVAAAVGAGGLGTYIFRGLRQNDNNLLIAGAVASAILALICDLGLGQVERSFAVGERSKGSRRRIIGGAAAAFLIAIVGFGAFLETNESTGSRSTDRKVIVGSKDFTESVILAEILSQMLERDGIAVERRFELGGNLPHDSLLAGEIDVYPEYTGTAFTAILKHPPVTDPQVVYSAAASEYDQNFDLVFSPPLGYANDFAILIRGDVARSRGLRTISNAVPVSRDWQAGFGQDFMSRADGYAGFVAAYGFEFARQPREMDLSLTYRALASGELDIIAGNSTDGLISVLDLFQLEDDRRYFPPYQAVFIARRKSLDLLKTAFNKLSGSISTHEMRRLNYRVDGEKVDPVIVAREWLDNR